MALTFPYWTANDGVMFSDNPYESPVIVAELVEPKRPKNVPSVGFRVIRAIFIAFAIFIVGCTTFFYWLVWMFDIQRR